MNNLLINNFVVIRFPPLPQATAYLVHGQERIQLDLTAIRVLPRLGEGVTIKGYRHEVVDVVYDSDKNTTDIHVSAK